MAVTACLPPVCRSLNPFVMTVTACLILVYRTFILPHGCSAPVCRSVHAPLIAVTACLPPVCRSHHPLSWLSLPSSTGTNIYAPVCLSLPAPRMFVNFWYSMSLTACSYHCLPPSGLSLPDTRYQACHSMSVLSLPLPASSRLVTACL
jgi:hypothetical protein